MVKPIALFLYQEVLYEKRSFEMACIWLATKFAVQRQGKDIEILLESKSSACSGEIGGGSVQIRICFGRIAVCSSIIPS